MEEKELFQILDEIQPGFWDSYTTKMSHMKDLYFSDFDSLIKKSENILCQPKPGRRV